MNQFKPNPRLLCCASIFALSLSACTQQTGKLKPDFSLNGNTGMESTGSNKVFRVKHRPRGMLAGPARDPKSYDNLWERLFDRFELPDIAHRDIDRELNWFLNHPTYIDRVQTRAEPFLYTIVKQLEKNHLPGELALLPIIESAFQPHAVSPAKAAGIWQFIPSTGRHYGLKQSHSYDGRRDIYASTRAAIRYFKKLSRDFQGDWLLAIAAYNCGEGAVSRSIQRNLARGLPTDFWSLELPQETRSYVPRLLAVAKLFFDADVYGVDLHPIPNMALYKPVKLDTQMDLALAADAADISLDRLFELNPGFRHQHVDVDGSYRLFIPADKKTRDFKAELARLAGGSGYSYDTQPPVASIPPTPVAPLPEAAPAILPVSYSADIAPPPAPIRPAQAQPAEAAPPSALAASNAAIEAQPTEGQRAQTPAYETARVEADRFEAPLESPPSAPVERSEAPASYAAAEPYVAAEPLEVESGQYEPADAVAQESPAAHIRPAVLRVTRPSPAAERHAAPMPRAQAPERSASASKASLKAAMPAHEAPPLGKPQSKEKPATAREGKELDANGKKSLHEVQPGETVFSIATRNGMEVEQFKKLNHIGADNHIESGQSLVVWNQDAARKLSLAATGAGIKPSQSLKLAAAREYVVRQGDSVFAISKRFNVSLADLRKWNGVKVDKQFKPGVNLTVSSEKD
jgi:membrane-bound lytic murein transglycosylase D